jgi:hypothetical protein
MSSENARATEVAEGGVQVDRWPTIVHADLARLDWLELFIAAREGVKDLHEVIGVCFGGLRDDPAVGRPASPPGPRRPRPSRAPMVSPGRRRGVSGARDTGVKSNLGAPGLAVSEGPRQGRRRASQPSARERGRSDYATRECAGGLCAGAGQRARCRRSFPITSGCASKAMSPIGPVQQGHARGSTAYTCLKPCPGALRDRGGELAELTSPRGGSMAADEGFRIVVPSFDTIVK